MEHSIAEFVAIAAHIERAESHQPACRVAVDSDSTVATVIPLWNIVLEQSCDEWVGKRPVGNGLELAAIKADDHWTERDGLAR